MKILSVNTHLTYPGWSEGKLNLAFMDLAKAFFVERGYPVAETFVERGYVPEEEVKKHAAADLVILQTPVNWFSAPWIYKKYVDEVFNVGLDLLDAQNVRWVSKVIEDYESEGTAEDMWSPYNGTQPNDPAKLGAALVKIAAMPNPPKVFIAGSDALDVITPAIEERLREARAHETLSKSTGGSL